MHLFGNMLFLWIYGDNVEHRMGALPFLFWYLATGVARRSSTAVRLVVCAATRRRVGGDLGRAGVLFRLFPHNRVRLWIFLFPLFANIVLVPARIVLACTCSSTTRCRSWCRAGEGGGVAYGAHIGGFLAGLVVAFVANRLGSRERPTAFRAAGGEATSEAAEAPRTASPTRSPKGAWRRPRRGTSSSHPSRRAGFSGRRIPGAWRLAARAGPHASGRRGVPAPPARLSAQRRRRRGARGARPRAAHPSISRRRRTRPGRSARLGPSPETEAIRAPGAARDRRETEVSGRTEESTVGLALGVAWGLPEPRARAQSPKPEPKARAQSLS